MLERIYKVLPLLLIRSSFVVPKLSTKVSYFFYKRWGMIFLGEPNYISSSAWFDGVNYSLITLHNGCTISANVTFLTHDWSLYMIGKSLNKGNTPVKSRNKPIVIGENSFIGMGSIIMPGTTIGKGCVVGAGSVVRGNVPDFSIVIGNPASIVSDSKEYYEKNIESFNKEINSYK